MPYKAFMKNVGNEACESLVQSLVSAFQNKNAIFNVEQAVIPYAQRNMLCAGSDSAYLYNMTINLIYGI